MRHLKRTVVMAVALAAATGLAGAAEARERGVGHGADRVTRHAGTGHLERGRHDVRHERYRKRGHGYGHHRYRAWSRHGHYRHRGRHLGKHRFRPHKGYAPYRKYRHRYRHHRYYRYGISFELDGVRYFLGGSDYRR